MSNEQLQMMIDSFTSTSDSASEQLKALLRVISEGKAPASKDIDDMNETILKLQGQYNEIYEFTASHVLDTERPENGLAVSEYLEIIEGSLLRALQDRLNDAREILGKFVRVKSFIEEYSNVLKPFQIEAQNLIDKLSEVESVLSAEGIPDTSAQDLFVQALNSDLRTSSGIQLMWEISKYYPQEVQWGLMANAYVCDDTASVESNVDIEPTGSSELITDDTNECIDEESDEMRESSDLASVEKPVVEANDRTDDGNNNVPETQTVVGGDADNSVPEKSEDSETSAAMTEDGLLIASNKVKTTSPSASAFKKDIIRLAGTHRYVKFILPMLTNLGVMTAEQIYKVGICLEFFEEDSKEKFNVENAIDALCSKGYLARFEYDENNDTVKAFCLSSYCYLSMMKDTIAQLKGFWGTNYGAFKVYVKDTVEKKVVQDTVNANRLLVQYLYNEKNVCDEEQYHRIKESIHWDGSYYRVVLYYENVEYSAILFNDAAVFKDVNDTNLLIIYDSYLEEADIGSLSGLFEKIFVFRDQAVMLYGSEESEESAEIKEVTENLPDEKSEEVTISLDQIEIKTEFIPETEEEAKNIEIVNDQQLVIAEDKQQVRTPSDLKDLKRVPMDDEFCECVRSLIERTVTSKEELKRNIVQALMLAKSASYIEGYDASKKLSGQLQLATFISLGDGIYNSQILNTYFDNVYNEDQCLLYTAYAFAMLAPARPYDYALKNQTEQIMRDYDRIFSDLSMFKALFNKLLTVQDIVPTGFAPAVIALLGTNEENEQYSNELRREAQSYMTVTPPKARLKALPTMYSACFDKGSDLYECMEIIAENRRDDKEWVESVLADYCDEQSGIYVLNENKIEDKLSKAWDDANPKRTFKLEYDAHSQAMRQFNTRLQLMKNWVDHISSLENKEDVARLKSLKSSIVSEIEDLLKFRSWRGIHNANILEWSLNRMVEYLNGKNSAIETFSDLLSTGIISMADDGYPILDSALQDVKYYEPWRNVVKHINSSRKTFSDIREEILSGNDSGLFDNLHQLSMIGKYLKDSTAEYQITEEHENEAIVAANDKIVRFCEHLELAYTYNQINETEKETLLSIMNKFRSQFFELKDFACWRRLLDALEKQVEEYATERKEKIVASLNSRIQKAPNSTLLAEAARLLEEDRNFSVAEEYINRFDIGETEFSGNADVFMHDTDSFDDFLSEKKFDPIFKECTRHRGKSLKQFGVSYFKNNVPSGWSERLRRDSENLLSNWPVSKNRASTSQIQTLFTCLGFDVTKVEKQIERKEESYKLYIKPTDKSKVDYLHPISAFGTQVKSPINAVILYGIYTEKAIVDTITGLDMRGISIVLIDKPIDIPRRRQIAEIFHTQTSGQNAFLLIDQVLILYLSFMQSTERLPALLKCTLPYTTYQPFVRDGGSTADEMFCGRTKELATILDPNGACVVYGGRQLGKTALLERAESRFAQPDNKIYAVYTSIIHDDSEAKFVAKVASDIESKTDGKITLQNCETIASLCKQLGEMFRRGKISAMLLLIDEADNFLASIADNGYRELQPLIDLKRETTNNFKFVLAGLHNVCRAKKATERNGVFGQLGTPLCVKPLSPTDALQLLSKPLRYLGFQIDRYPHLETILTNTNYYPGILQFFGYNLVETLTSQYSKYYSATDGNPPFTLQDDQLGAVMNSADLNKSIKDKFRWSLELDTRYFMIARCITMLYHLYEDERSSSSWLGYSVKDIMEMAELYEIKCLEKEDIASYTILLDEMVEMGILSQPKQGVYRLRRSSFVDIIGEDPDVLEEEIKYNNEVD